MTNPAVARVKDDLANLRDPWLLLVVKRHCMDRKKDGWLSHAPSLSFFMQPFVLSLTKGGDRHTFCQTKSDVVAMPGL